jgi:spermidine synthase
MSETFTPMADLIPEGEKGNVQIRHFNVSDRDAAATALRAVVTRGREEPVLAGRYCKLLVGNEVMMSDTSMEKRTNYEVVCQARGHVFIAGLGIGMILVPILAKPEVTKITVVERSQDVIDLVSPHFSDHRLEVIHADVFDYKPSKGVRYDVVYHDIWATLSPSDLEEMTKLHRKYGRYLKPGGWQESWRRDELRRHKAQKARSTSWW